MQLLPGVEIVAQQPALLLKDFGALVIADLHIGLEAALEKEGIHLPVSSYSRMKEQLALLLEQVDADRLIILGDLKHEFGEPSVQEWVEVKDLLSWLQAEKIRVEVVRGNHDNYVIWILKKFEVPLHDPALLLGSIFMFHGHKTVEIPSSAEAIIIAHEHPAISIKDDSGAKFKFKCFLLGSYQGVPLAVVPSYSPLASGVSVNEISPEEFLTPLLREVEIDEFTPFVVEPGAGVYQFPPIKFLRQFPQPL